MADDGFFTHICHSFYEAVFIRFRYLLIDCEDNDDYSPHICGEYLAV